MLTKARRPVGKGIPIANPSGTSSIPLTSSLIVKERPTRETRIAGSTKTYNHYKKIATVITVSGTQFCTVVDSQRRETRLPAPLESSSRKITTVKA